MQCIMFDNNCAWIFWKFPYFTCFTKTSGTQSITTFAYTLRRELLTIYLFVLHQMRTPWIMSLIRSTTSAQISIPWKVWSFTSSNIWPWSSIFCRFKAFGFVYWEDIHTFIVNITWQIVWKHWVIFFLVMFNDINLTTGSTTNIWFCFT